MALPGECLGAYEHTCEDCKIEMKLSVCQSAAGYYLGFMCNCGPYSRETGYYAIASEAQAVLDGGLIPWR